MSTDNELGQSSTVGINHDNMSNDNDLGQSPTVGISHDSMSNDNELRQSATIGINDSMGDDNELGQSPTVGISDSMSNQLGQSVSLYCFYVRTVWRQFVKSAQCQRKGQGKHAVV